MGYPDTILPFSLQMALPRVMTRIRDSSLVLPKVNIPGLPEKWKGGRVEKLAHYLANVARDYSESFQELYKGALNRPRKALVISSTLGLGYYMYHHNPNERTFRDVYLRHNFDISLLGENVRNPCCTRSQDSIARYFNSEELRRWNLGLFSIMWRDHYSDKCGHALANCKYTKIGYFNFWDRIVDVGAFDRWWLISRNMRDFDVNPEEWHPDGSPTRPNTLSMAMPDE
ncbi:mitochondrial import inner membrane translocase subunit Tim29-like [Tigriopus californicus]|uniref:mitochondrial import inner membrane translocase subunit Tim29-like n=1 Tax=Tigriopus californicus TaxID=6832 RepID=UPI0027DA71C5|nr:mitochondrial import inner membrane translocase subunit Tim29-like [Tigriopus californicus]